MSECFRVRPSVVSGQNGSPIGFPAGVLFCSDRNWALAQPNWLKRFSTLDIVRQSTANLRNESPLIFGVPEGSRGELGRAQVQIGAGELRVLLHRLAGSYGLIPNDLCRRGPRLKEALLFDNPAVAEDFRVLRPQQSVGAALLTFDGHDIATGTLKNHFVSDLRLREGLGDRALNVFSPDLARAIPRLQSHEIRRLLIRIVSVGIPAVIEELADDALSYPFSRGGISTFGRCWRRAREGVCGDRIDPLAEAREVARERPNELRLFDLTRPVAANRKARQACLTPGLLAEALGPGHRDFRPATRVCDLDETVHDLCILALSRESSSLILERRRPIGEEEPMPVLYEPIADRLGNCPRIGICARESGGESFSGRGLAITRRLRRGALGGISRLLHC